MLNSVSRGLSDVGRRPSHAGVFSRLPFSVPAMTLIARLKLSCCFPSSHFDQPESFFPVFDQLSDRRRARLCPVEPRGRLALRDVEHLAIAHEIDQTERRHPGLARA